MAEQSVCTGRAVVYYFDSTKKAWANSPVAGYARLDIYKNTGTGGFRVIGRGIEDTSAIVINSPLSKDTVYVRSQEQFHQFQDPRYLYGLNFASAADAGTFGTEFEKAVNALKGGPAAPAPAPAKAPPPVAARPSPAAPASAPASAPPSGGPSKPPPMPPKAPPKPPPARAPASDAPPSGSDPGRGALLDSIQGFSKGKLKKAETVDKSGPVLGPAKPAASSESSGDGGGPGKAAGSTGTLGRTSAAAAAAPPGGDMMASIMAKRAAMQSKASSPAPAAEPKPVEPKKPPVPAMKAKPGPDTSKPAPPARNPRPVSPRAAEETTSHSPKNTSSQQSALPEHFQALKDEILAEVRLELAQLKTELLAAIRGK
jgi:hypothetical protein